MSLTRSLCAGAALIVLVGALWNPVARCATPDALSTAGLALAPAPFAGPPAAGALQDAEELPPFKPVARVNSLMRGIGTAMGQLSETLPKTEDEHRLDTITAWAELIAELSNVHARHRRKPEYLAMAANTGSIALELAREARADAPDEAQMARLLATLDTSCSTCHDSDH